MRTNEVAKTISATARSVKIPSRQPLRSRPARFKKSSRVSIQLSNKEESQVRGHSKRCGRKIHQVYVCSEERGLHISALSLLRRRTVRKASRICLGIGLPSILRAGSL